MLPNKTNTAKARSSCATRKCGAGQFGCQNSELEPDSELEWQNTHAE